MTCLPEMLIKDLSFFSIFFLLLLILTWRFCLNFLKIITETTFFFFFCYKHILFTCTANGNQYNHNKNVTHQRINCHKQAN